eukprot:TRINITY_DN10991_c0_g1_i4.p1 TRINITY_DN10991_c0_g1~~TRINITY_DN10991_c0_g1_i4.p1  ORF type:complete len:212 (+),score=-13.45 TRINITY_DN10991_c0_g1_i4:779-1414(+)
MHLLCGCSTSSLQHHQTRDAPPCMHSTTNYSTSTCSKYVNKFQNILLNQRTYHQIKSYEKQKICFLYNALLLIQTLYVQYKFQRYCFCIYTLQPNKHAQRVNFPPQKYRGKALQQCCWISKIKNKILMRNKIIISQKSYVTQVNDVVNYKCLHSNINIFGFNLYSKSGRAETKLPNFIMKHSYKQYKSPNFLKLTCNKISNPDTQNSRYMS